MLGKATPLQGTPVVGGGAQAVGLSHVPGRLGHLHLHQATASGCHLVARARNIHSGPSKLRCPTRGSTCVLRAQLL